jgi:hypothetical protein
MITAQTKHKKLASTGETKDYVYYHCTHRKDTRFFKCSERRNISILEIEKQIEGIISNVTIPEDFFEWAKSALKKLHSNDAELYEAALVSLDTTIAQLQNRKTKLTSLFIDELLSETEYKERKKELETELSMLQAERQEKTLRKSNLHEMVESTFDFAAKAHDRFKFGDIETRKLIFRSLGSNYVLMGGKLSINLHSYFVPIQKYNNVRDGSLSRLEPTKKSIGMRDTDALSA